MGGWKLVSVSETIIQKGRKMKKLLLGFVCAAFFSCGAAELKQWEFKTPRDLMGDRIYAYAAKGSLVEKSLSSEKTPDGAPSLKVSLKQIAPGAPSHAVQLNCIYNKPLEKGKKYRIQFYCRGSVSGKIMLLAAQGGAPYKTLGKKASVWVHVTAEWQLCTFEFTPELTAEDNRYVLPRMLLAGYPAGGELFFGPVMLSDETK